MPSHIIPNKSIQHVLDNPLGTNVLINHISYPNPNRFFSHWLFKQYFLKVPILLQNFTDPISSIYHASALAKTIFQLTLILLLTIIITGKCNPLKLDFLLAAVITIPFFQTNGYRTYMGIIDPCITYTFFYALPCALLLLYLTPFFLLKIHHLKIFSNKHFFWYLTLLAIICSLSGPLNPGIAIIIFFLAITYIMYLKFFNVNNSISFHNISETQLGELKNQLNILIPLTFFSVYSILIGRFNSNNVETPILSLFSKIPDGLYYLFTQKIGFPLLVCIVIINLLLIKFIIKDIKSKQILTIAKWVGLFSFIYILLLPFGGYRLYRPNILRFDTIMPITLALIYLFGYSSIFILHNIKSKYRWCYILELIFIAIIYTNADKGEFDNNKLERETMQNLALTNDSIYSIENGSTLLSWDKIKKPEDSKEGAIYLMRMNITKKTILYYNE